MFRDIYHLGKNKQTTLFLLRYSESYFFYLYRLFHSFVLNLFISEVFLLSSHLVPSVMMYRQAKFDLKKQYGILHGSVFGNILARWILRVRTKQFGP